MGMKNKMAKIASIAAMMAIANGDEVHDIPQARPKKPLSKGESKKCKSCEFFKGCPERPAPMDTACGNYKRKKKSR